MIKVGSAYLVVRIKGQADVPHWARRTLELLKLEKKFRATILPAKYNTLGMLNKIKHYISWFEIDVELAKELLDKKARKSGYQKATADDLKSLGFDSVDAMASALSEGSAVLSKLKPLKPWFALAPPRHGFKRSTKRLYKQKGILGQNKDLGTLVRNMI